jgi:hypothetical protein
MNGALYIYNRKFRFMPRDCSRHNLSRYTHTCRETHIVYEPNCSLSHLTVGVIGESKKYYKKLVETVLTIQRYSLNIFDDTRGV